MNVNLRVILAIVRKDFHGVLPLILLALAVFIAQPVIANLNLENEAEFWSMLQIGFYWLGYFLAMLLMISVLQLDPATSLNHDWLTRPIARVNWLLAKLLFLLLTVCVPIVAARFVVNLGNDYGVIELFDYATAIVYPAPWLAAPILFAIALLTPTLKRAIFVLVVICVVFMVPAWDGGRYLLSRIGVDISNDFGSMMWLQSLPILAMGVGSALLVYWLLYCRRRQARAWLAFGLSFAFVFFCIFPPAAIYGWDELIAVHERMINEPDDSLEDAVVLDHSLACFPAAPMGGSIATEGNDQGVVQEGTDPLLVQADWDLPIFTQVEPGSLTFATVVNARNTLREWYSPSNTAMNVPVDWRIDRIRARGRFTAESIPSDVELLRSSSAVNATANMSPTDTDYWLIPGRVVDALAHDQTTRLILDYDLALLSPTPYELKTDGQRRDLGELGSCRAEIDRRGNKIVIDCRKEGAQPDLVSAELVGISSSRVDSSYRPTYTPDWLESIGRRRYELTLESPNLVDSSVVMLTAYNVERILHKRLESRGLLGGPASICPLPTEERDAIERSSWSDKSPHEVSSIAVERGVRVEVLDWRTGDQTGKPVLFLIPGLGATAHMYDDVAPKLAERYAVIGMTRRGIGDSSKPDHGYDIARLSRDVIQVLDTLGIESAILVGSSIGGEELSFLGAHHPGRFAGLIYLDAAYDRVTNTGSLPMQDDLLPARPPPLPSDIVSYEAVKQYALRTGGAARIVPGSGGLVRYIPEGEIMASYDLNTLAPKHASLYLEAIEMGLQAPEYERIPLPALGVFAMPSSPEFFMEPWYDRDDPVVRQAVAEGFRWVQRIKEDQIARFSEGIADSEVLVIDDAEHWILVSHEEDVLSAIDAFVERL